MAKKQKPDDEITPEQEFMLGGGAGSYVPPELRPLRRKILRKQREAAAAAAAEAPGRKRPAPSK